MARVSLRIAAWSVIALPLCFLWGELFVRVLLSQSRDTVMDIVRGDIIAERQRYPEGYYQLDDSTGLISARPGYKGYRESEHGRVFVDTNPYGGRGPYLDPKNQHAVRVLILGDSFIQAIQVNHRQTFGHLLAATSSRQLQVMQQGVPCWGQGDQYRWLEAHYDSIRPDVVIVAAFLANDLFDNMKPGNLGSSTYRVSPSGFLLTGKASAGESRQSPSSGLDPSASHLYRLVRGSLKRTRSTFRARIQQVGFRLRGTAGLRSRPPRVAPYHRAYLSLYARDQEQTREKFDTFETLIRRFRDLAEEKGFELLIMLIPWDRGMLSDRFSGLVEHFSLPYDEYDQLVLHERARHVLARAHVPCLDLWDEFSKQTEPSLAYGEVDAHLSPTGHRWVAGALEPRLLALLASRTKERRGLTVSGWRGREE